jgi:hypothetical protein
LSSTLMLLEHRQAAVRVAKRSPPNQ